MKNVFILSIILVFVVACEKESVNDKEIFTQDELISLKQTPPVVYANGHIYSITSLGAVHIGYYMRKYRTKRCRGRNGNCLPDVDVSGIAYTEEDENGNYNIIAVPLKTISVINDKYTEPLNKALYNDDQEAIRSLFFNILVPKTENLPEKLTNDFKNGKLTMKRFNENAFIVNRGANEPTDIENYWE